MTLSLASLGLNATTGSNPTTICKQGKKRKMASSSIIIEMNMLRNTYSQKAMIPKPSKNNMILMTIQWIMNPIIPMTIQVMVTSMLLQISIKSHKSQWLSPTMILWVLHKAHKNILPLAPHSKRPKTCSLLATTGKHSEMMNNQSKPKWQSQNSMKSQRLRAASTRPSPLLKQLL